MTGWLLELRTDELCLSCADGSLRLCERLASTNTCLRMRMRSAAEQHGLRLLAENCSNAIRAERRSCFHVGELILRSCERLDVHELFALVEELPKMHKLVLPPHLGSVVLNIKNFQASPHYAKDPLWPRCSTIVVTTRRVKRVTPSASH